MNLKDSLYQTFAGFCEPRLMVFAESVPVIHDGLRCATYEAVSASHPVSQHTLNTRRPCHLKDRFEPQPHAFDTLRNSKRVVPSLLHYKSSLTITAFYDTMT